MVEADAEISDADPFVATLSARASSGVPPFTFAWRKVGGPEGSEVTFENDAAATTAAAFSACGIYIVEVRATDSMGVSTPFSFPIEIVDSSANLVVDIIPPACSQSQLDACVALGGSISLDVDVSGISVSSGVLYEWEVVDGAGSGVLADETTASPTLTAIGPDTLAVQVTVTDEDSCQTATDQISVEVILEGQLTVDILSDGSATLNQPEVLLANVSGAIGELAYSWEVIDGTGTFDDATTQNVLFTPTIRPSVTVQVSVTDSARDACSTDDQCAVGESCNEDNDCAAIATETINIATFDVSISGETSIPRNTLASYTAPLSGDAPDSTTYLWSFEKQDPDDATLLIMLVDETAATLQLLPQERSSVACANYAGQ